MMCAGNRDLENERMDLEDLKSKGTILTEEDSYPILSLSFSLLERERESWI